MKARIQKLFLLRCGPGLLPNQGLSRNRNMDKSALLLFV